MGDAVPFTVAVNATSAASPEAVFRHLAIAEAWTVWGRLPRPLRAVRERAGPEVPDGVGAIRRIGLVREETVTHESPRHFGYVMRNWAPFTGYRGDVTLTAIDGGGTAVRWQASLQPKIPGTGPLLRGFSSAMLGMLVKRVAAHAEHCQPGCPARQSPS
jgi:hypothetical protein